MSLQDFVERASNACRTRLPRWFGKVVRYVDFQLEADVRLVGGRQIAHAFRAGLTLIGRIVRAGVDKVSKLWSRRPHWRDCNPTSFASFVLDRYRARPKKSDKINREAIILMVIAAIAVMAAGIAFGGTLGFAANWIISTLSFIVLTICNTEHFAELRNQTNGAADLLIMMGGAYFLARFFLNYWVAAADMAAATESKFVLKAALKDLWKEDLFKKDIWTAAFWKSEKVKETIRFGAAMPRRIRSVIGCATGSFTMLKPIVMAFAKRIRKFLFRGSDDSSTTAAAA